MPESTVKPDVIEIDSIKNGKVNMLVRWDIQQEERTDEMSGKAQTIYTYEECAFRGKNGWALPYAMTSRDEVAAYLATIEDELLGWAKGSQIHMIEETIVVAKSAKVAKAEYLKSKKGAKVNEVVVERSL